MTAHASKRWASGWTATSMVHGLPAAGKMVLSVTRSGGVGMTYENTTPLPCVPPTGVLQ